MVEAFPKSSRLARVIVIAGAVLATLTAPERSPAAGPVQWRFVSQRNNAIILRIVPAEETTTFSAALRHNACVAIPLRAGLRCLTLGYANSIKLYPPEPLRDVTMVRVEILPQCEQMASTSAQFQAFEFQVTDIPAAPTTPSASLSTTSTALSTASTPLSSPTSSVLFNPDFSFDRMTDALAINTPVPAAYRRPDLRAVNPDLSKGRWAFPPECPDAVEIDTSPTKGIVRVKVSDALKLLDLAPTGDMFPWDLCLWNEGAALAYYVSRRPLDTESFIYFPSPKDAAPYFNGSRVYLTVGAGAAAGASAPASRAALAESIAAADRSLEIAPAAMRRVRRPDWDVRPRGADILVVTVPLFHEPILPLIQRRRDQGYRVEIADVGDLYLCYGAGLPRPSAIRAFAADAFMRWTPPAPTYLTLVGDASTWFGDDNTSSAACQVPSFYEQPPLHDWIPANDAGFACFTGSGMLPAMIVGRLTVREAGEAQAVANKIVRYETAADFGPWRQRALWMLDSGYEYLFAPGAVASPPPLVTRRLEVMEYPFMDHYWLPGVKVSPPCNREMMGRLSDGCLVMHYAGHGGVTLLSKQKVFYHKDVALLENGLRLPFCTQISCHTGNFDFPTKPYTASIAELMLRKGNGGAIGVFAASRAIWGDEYTLQCGVFQGLYRRPRTTLGLATMEAKARLTLTQGKRDSFGDSYNLMGDPATVFTRPPDNLTVQIESPATIEAPEPAEIHLRGKAKDGHLSGRVWLMLTDEKGRELNKSETTMTQGAFEGALDLPPGFMGRRLCVAAYAADPKEKWEGGGMAVIPVTPMRVRENLAQDAPRISFLQGAIRLAGRGAELVDGETVFMYCRLVNRGKASTAPVKVLWRRRLAGTPDAKKELAAEMSVEPLSAGEIRPVLLRWDAFHTTGDYLFDLTLEGAGVTSPSVSGDISARILPKSDLCVKPGDLVAEIRDAKTIRAWLTVANIGGSHSGKTTAQIFLASRGGTHMPLSAPIPTPAIAPGDAVKLGPIDMPMPEGLRPPFGLIARVDIYQDYTELNEENNETAALVGAN
ncbi:MAG: C25 family cysteine peptidase [Candidatus Sumerlaeota bacterium]|nr:C25 family cysteine peptidase [Candidatus Sumerlaeota bacterium]